MKLLPMGSSSGGVRWHAKPGEDETIDPVTIRKIFAQTCPHDSIAIEDMRDGTYVLVFPDGIEATKRSELYRSIESAGFALV